MSTPARRRPVWRAPILVALASGVGLISALLGDGVYDVIAWVCLLIPVLLILKSFRQGKS